MQSLIVAIKSPLFLTVFFGTAALAALLGIAAPLRWSEPGALYLLIGSLLYLNGPFGVTLLKNLPLNNKLLPMKPESADAGRYWNEFRAAWGQWNHVRWIGALGASAAFGLAFMNSALRSSRPMESFTPCGRNVIASGWTIANERHDSSSWSSNWGS